MRRHIMVHGLLRFLTSQETTLSTSRLRRMLATWLAVVHSETESLGRRHAEIALIVSGDVGRCYREAMFRFRSHSFFRTAYRYSSAHPPLNQMFSRKCPSRRMFSRSSSAAEGAFLQSANAMTRCSPSALNA